MEKKPLCGESAYRTVRSVQTRASLTACARTHAGAGRTFSYPELAPCTGSLIIVASTHCRGLSPRECLSLLGRSNKMSSTAGLKLQTLLSHSPRCGVPKVTVPAWVGPWRGPSLELCPHMAFLSVRTKRDPVFLPLV